MLLGVLYKYKIRNIQKYIKIYIYFTCTHTHIYIRIYAYLHLHMTIMKVKEAFINQPDQMP